MKKISFTLLLAALVFSPIFAQSNSEGIGLVGILLVVAAFILLMALLFLADSAVRVEADKQGLDDEDANLGLIPSLRGAFGPKLPDFAPDGYGHAFTKGFDINLTGSPEPRFLEDVNVTTYAIQPPNFRGIFPIPKMVVQIGDEVKAGQEIFFDKSNPKIKYVAPVSGEVIAINRAAKRSISEVVILADKEQQYREYQVPSLASSTREELYDFLMDSGAWMLLRQRPYDVVADPDTVPRDIYISAFDTAPNAPDLDWILEGQKEDFYKGIEVLSHLTDGKVRLGLDGNQKPSDLLTQTPHAEIHYFKGAHPAGNVGVHIHNTSPIVGDDVVWTLGVQEVLTIGRLWTHKKYDSSRVISITGGLLEETGYVKTHVGAKVSDLVAGRIRETEDQIRYISGDVLSGSTKSEDSFLNIYDDQLSLLSEGDHYDLFGWISPFVEVPSQSPTLPLGGFSDVAYDVDTNTHGERRAFVLTGQYEQVTPMDLYPQHLIKAIMTNDIERMEGLGIKEVIEEDLALCEYVCTSKMPVQEILRDGLDYLRDQE